MQFKEIVNFLGVAGSIAAPFNPAVGGGLVLASKALGKFEEFNDNSLETDFVGLSSLAEELKIMVAQNQYDAQKITQIAESLATLSSVFGKFTKMVG